MTDAQKNLLTNLLEENLFCVVSSVNSMGCSESAVVAFTSFSDLKIAFQTPNTTRKYRNIKLNQKVSIVVGWDEKKLVTVQYEGIARELIDEKEINEVRKHQLRKNLHSKKYAYLEENKYFLVEPSWVRYTDISKDPNLVFEELQMAK